jgi:hypothetical protein
MEEGPPAEALGTQAPSFHRIANSIALKLIDRRNLHKYLKISTFEQIYYILVCIRNLPWNSSGYMAK